jgi:hypothetical protein
MWHVGRVIFLYILHLPAIISFGGVTNDHKEEAKNHGLSIFSWEEFLIMVSKALGFFSLRCRLLTCSSRTSGVVWILCFTKPVPIISTFSLTVENYVYMSL